MKKQLQIHNPAFLHLDQNIDQIAYSPDGTKLFGISDYGTNPHISVWDSTTGNLIQKIISENIKYDRRFQIQENTLIYSHHDYKQISIQLYDLSQNQWENALFFFPCTSYYGVLHLTSQELWAFQSDGLLIFDRKTGELLHQYETPINKENENGYAIASNGEILACGNWKTNEVFILDKQANTLNKFQVSGLHDGFGAHLLLSSDGKILITATIKQYYQLIAECWDTATGKLLQKIEKYHRGYVKSLNFSPDETHLLIRTTGIDVLYYEWQTGELIWEKPNMILNTASAFSPDGKKLAISAGKRVLFYDTTTGNQIDKQAFAWNNIIKNFLYNPLNQMLFLQDGNTLLSLNTQTHQQETLLETTELNSYIHPQHGFFLRNATEVLQLNTENSEIQTLINRKVDTLTFSDKYIATTDHYFSGEKIKKLRLWTYNGKEKKILGAGKANLPDYMVLTPNNQHLICVKGKRLWIIAIDTEQIILDEKILPGSTSQLLISPDGDYIAILGKTQVQIWHIPTLKLLFCLKTPKNTLNISFAPEGSLLLLTTTEGNIHYLDYYSVNPKIEKHAQKLALPHTCINSYLAEDATLWLSLSDCSIEKWDISDLIKPLTPKEKISIQGEFIIPEKGKSKALLAHFTAANWELYTPEKDFLPLRKLLSTVEIEEGIGELHHFCSEKIIQKGGRLLHRFGHNSPIASYAISSCGTWLATGSWVGDDYEEGGELQIWEIETGRCVNIIDDIEGGVGWPDYERCLQWSLDSQWLGMAYNTNGVGNINPFGTSPHPLNQHYVTDGWSRPPAFCWQPNNEAFHIACWFGEKIPGCIAPLSRSKKKCFGFKGKLPKTFPHSTISDGLPHIEPMKWTNWSRDGKRVYGHNSHSQAFSIQVETGEIDYIAGIKSPIAWSPDDTIFADATGGIRFSDAKTGKEISKHGDIVGPSDMQWVNILDKRILAVWSVDNKKVLIYENEQKLCTIKTALKAEYWNFPDGKAWTFSLDAKKGASLSPEGIVSIWDLENKGTLLLSFQVQTKARGILWGKNDTLIAVNEDVLSFWDTKTGDCITIQNLQMPEGMVYPAKEDYPLFTPKKDIAAQFEVNPSFPMFKNGEMQWVTAFENGLVICPFDFQSDLRQELAYTIQNKWTLPYYWRKPNIITDITALQKHALNPLTDKDTSLLQTLKPHTTPRNQLIEITSFEKLFDAEERKNFWKDTIKQSKIQEFEMAIKDVAAYKVPNPLKGTDINAQNMTAFLGKSVMYAENWRPNYRIVVTIINVKKNYATYFYIKYKDGKPKGSRGSGSMTYSEMLFIGLVEGK